jgi:hypothetical protein
MTQYETPEKSPQAVSRLGLYLPTGLLLLFVLCWSGFWLYAAKKADEGLSAWLAAEKVGGRNWECIGKNIGGYPFRIELRCDAVKFSSALMKANLGQLNAATQIYSPKLVLADISGPLQIDSAGVGNLFNWSNLRISLRFGRELERLSMSFTEFRAGERADDIGIRAKNFEFHLRTDTERPAEEQAADFVVSMNEIRAPTLDTFFGNQDTGSLSLSGSLTRIWNLRAGSWQSTLENWRAQNGQITLDAGHIAKGSFILEGKGTLVLDPARRLQGELIAGARGIGPVISRFVSGNAAQLAGALLDRKDGSMVQLPLRFQDGRISFGPVRTGPILTPLY